MEDGISECFRMLSGVLVGFQLPSSTTVEIL